jgi:hypothetical protein
MAMGTEHDPMAARDATAAEADNANDLLNMAPHPEVALTAEAISVDPSIATNRGAVLFQFIGQKPSDTRYSAVLQENADILLAMGGLIHAYMNRTRPVVDQEVLDINTWSGVISHIPNLAIGRPVQKFHANRIPGTQVAANFLGMIANAVIIDGASVLTDFTAHLKAIGDAVFHVNSSQQTYDIITCTYQNYLVDNGFGGYYDYSAIVLRQLHFRDYFQNFKSCCGSTEPVEMDLEYTEIKSLVQMGRIRRGGPDRRNFHELINDADTACFLAAGNVFNGEAPQSQIRPMV